MSTETTAESRPPEEQRSPPGIIQRYGLHFFYLACGAVLADGSTLAGALIGGAAVFTLLAVIRYIFTDDPIYEQQR